MVFSTWPSLSFNLSEANTSWVSLLSSCPALLAVSEQEPRTMPANKVTAGSPHLARLNFLAVDARVGDLRFAGVLVIGTDSVKGNSKGVQSICGPGYRAFRDSLIE